MRLPLSLLFSMLLLATPITAEQSRPDILAIALRYVGAQQAAMQEKAGASQADALMQFYTNDYVYVHPEFGARITGRAAIRHGIMSQFGLTSKASIVVKGALLNGNMVSLALEERFTTAVGTKVDRPRMTILTFRGDKIAQRVDV
jgi:ketosteroid isomerase-like protein